MNSDVIISRTKCWLRNVVVACNFCPFAKRELERDTIRYAVCEESKLESCVETVFQECVFLDSNEAVETTLIVFSKAFKSFDDFLDCVEIAEQLLAEQGYEGVYQLASFHPDYCFADATNDDAANYTNRSPFPMLHLLREASLEKALLSYPDSENIPKRNVENARELGLEVMKAKLAGCRNE